MNANNITRIVVAGAALFWLAYVFAELRRPEILPEDPKAMAGSLADLAEDKARKYGVTGAFVGVLNGDRFYGRPIGFADDEKSRPITEHTPFNVGSVSKPITAMGVMALAEDGFIELDAPAENYLKQWRFPEGDYDVSQVTVRQLLQHTAGTSVPGYAGYPSLTEAEARPFRSTKLPPRSLAESASSNYPIQIVRKPGERRVYSGGGYSVLQMLVEDVSGRGFSEFISSRIFTPAGMSNASYQPLDIPHRSLSFNYKGEALPDMHFLALAAAGLYASASDIRAFVETQLDDGGNVLSMEYARQMLEPVAEDTRYAMSYTRQETPAGVLYGHGGNNSSWHAQIYFMPAKDAAYYFLTNSTVGAQFEIDISCAWKAWAIGQTAKTTCRSEYVLTRNLAIATAIIGMLAIFAIGRIGILKMNRKTYFSLWPRKFGAFRNFARLIAILLAGSFFLFLCTLFFSDFFYWREGVVFRDEIPLHEMRLLIPAILALQTGIFLNLLSAKRM